MSDSELIRALEQGLEPSPAGNYKLTLYVAGSSPRSRRAVANFRRLCETHLRDRVEFEVIDVFQQCEKAGAADIVAVPTLIREAPLPLRRLLGDLSDERRVLIALDLAPDD